MKKQQKTGRKLTAKDMSALRGGLRYCNTQEDCGPVCPDDGSLPYTWYCTGSVCRKYPCALA